MKKILLYIASAALLFTSCTSEMREAADDINSDDKVTVSFDVALPVSGPMTKALGEDAAIKNLYVAVFDQGGYLVESVKARFLNVTVVDGENVYSDATPAGGIYSPDSEGIYTFEVTLTTTDEPRTLHFIANSPVNSIEWGSEIQRMTALVTENNEDAYWQRIVLDGGIVANVQEMRTRLGGTISLVRNFAKVSISSGSSNFKLESAKIYNVPDKGTVAIYTPENGFVGGYQNHDFAWASNPANYGGYTPASASLLSNFSESEFIDADIIDPEDETSGVVTDYIYERPAPTGSPVFAIVKGRYRGPGVYAWSSDPVYYKINLRGNDGGYYPFLRNYSYKIKIRTVGLQGYSTLKDALESTGDGGDVSTNIEYADLTDISAYGSRMIVSETTLNVIGSQTVDFQFKYQPDVTEATISNESVSVTLGEPGIYGSAISSYSVAGSDSADGSRTITVVTTDADPTYIKSQTLTLVGTNASGNTLQRVLTINVRPTMEMRAKCTKKVAALTGSPLVLSVGIPGGIPQSLFPLQFKIESEQSSIMPGTGMNLPVSNGASIIPGSSKPAFYYMKTLTWEEYLTVDTDEEGFKYFSSNFKTNRDESASMICVANEFFQTASCRFINGAVLSYDVAIDPMFVGTGSISSVMRVTTMDNTPFTVTIDGATPATSHYQPTDPDGETINIPIALTSFGNGVSYTVTADSGEDYEEYYPCSGTDYRTLRIPDGVLSASFSGDPCNGNYVSNTGTAYVSVGHTSGNAIGQVLFDVTRNGKSETVNFTAPNPSNTAVSGRSNGNFTVTVRMNRDSLDEYEFKWATLESTSYNGATSVGINNTTFTIEGSMGKNGTSTTIWLLAKPKDINSDFLSSPSKVKFVVSRSSKNSTSYSMSPQSIFFSEGQYTITNYTYTGVNEAKQVKLTQNVSSTSDIHFFINGKSDTETIDNIIQGTPGDELHIIL